MSCHGSFISIYKDSFIHHLFIQNLSLIHRISSFRWSFECSNFFSWSQLSDWLLNIQESKSHPKSASAKKLGFLKIGSAALLIPWNFASLAIIFPSFSHHFPIIFPIFYGHLGLETITISTPFGPHPWPPGVANARSADPVPDWRARPFWVRRAGRAAVPQWWQQNWPCSKPQK